MFGKLKLQKGKTIDNEEHSVVFGNKICKMVFAQNGNGIMTEIDSKLLCMLVNKQSSISWLDQKV